jgi:hypothetical protein
VTIFVSIVVLDAMKLDWVQRSTLGGAILLFSYFIGHTIQKRPEVTLSPSVESTPPSSRIKPSKLAAPRQVTSTPPTRGRTDRSNSPNSPLDPGGEAQAPTLYFIVKDSNGHPVNGAQVLVLAADNTYQQSQTDPEGKTDFLRPDNSPITVFSAREGFMAFYKKPVSSGGALEITLQSKPNGGSLIIAQDTGYVPGLNGRLNPILDSQGRMCFYAENIAIEGGMTQPFNIMLDKMIHVRDAQGHDFELKFLAIVGRSSLLEYYRR